MDNTIVTEEDFLNTYKDKIAGKKAINICKKNSWLPLKPSPTISSIVGHLMGDGNLSKDRMVGDFRFYGDKKKLDSIKEKLENVFKIKPRAYYLHPNGGGYILRYNNAIFSRILELVGSPRGNKVLNNFEIPMWIMLGDKGIKKAFLSSFFTDEMERINKNKIGYWAGLKLTMSKCQEKTDNLVYFFNQIKLLLNEFKITSSKIKTYEKRAFQRKDGHVTYPTRLCINTNIENRKIFYKTIGFEDKEKQKLLYSSLNSI